MTFIDDNGVSQFVDDNGVNSWVDDNGVVLGGSSMRVFTINLVTAPPPPAPEWIPEGAIMHIDLVGGSPQGRAWTQADGEVDVDTLLGADPVSGDGLYDPVNYVPEGYSFTEFFPYPPNFINALKNAYLSECTITFQYMQLQAELQTDIPGISARSLDYINEIMTQAQWWEPWNAEAMSSGPGPFSVVIPSIINMGLGALNKFAITITNTRFDMAVNGSDAVAGTMNSVDRPPGNPLVSVSISACGYTAHYLALQSITVYPTLPTTSGLKELSVAT
jgi:hypothetical protein